MVEISESFYTSLCETKFVLDKVVKAAEKIRENGPITGDIPVFGDAVIKILKEYLGDEW